MVGVHNELGPCDKGAVEQSNTLDLRAEAVTSSVTFTAPLLLENTDLTP